jgi:DNA polymerase-2
MLERAFILTADSYPTSRGEEIILHAANTKNNFEIVLSGESSVFFVEQSADCSGLKIKEEKSVPLKSFQDIPLKALYFDSNKNSYDSREKLKEKGIRTYESDMRPYERFLMERFIFGEVEFQIEKDYGHHNGTIRVENPQIRAAQSSVDFIPRVMSLDIETGMDGSLFSIAVDLSGPTTFKYVWMRAEENKKINEQLEYFDSEKSLLINFLEKFHQLDPDILIGWHVVGFDLMFLEKKVEKLGLEFNLGRKKKKIKLEHRQGRGYFATIPGRIVLDGPPALRASFYQFENFKLETVSSELLGVGKDIASDGGKVSEIERRFREDKLALAKYNLLDCELVTKIFDKTNLVELFITRSKISGLTIDRVGFSTAAFDFFFLPKLHRKKIAAPNSSDLDREVSAKGGFVLSPESGLYRNVAILDFKSLYPSIIRTFKIDPYSRLMGEKGIDIQTNPMGINFSKSEHILPDQIDVLMKKRALAKENNDQALSQAIKILMNSFYGVMGSTRSRFYHADLPTAITGCGQWAIKQAISFFENRDYQVIYGDTDSVFILLKESDVEKEGNFLAEEVTDFLSRLIKTEYGTESHLEMEFEGVYQKFFIPKMRGSDEGAKKRYVGYSFVQGEDKIDFKGMEFVRSDWTKASKNFQYELMLRVFKDESYKDWIKQYCDQLKEGKMDSDLVYSKRLTKSIDEYVKNIPPHVRAAKILADAGHEVGRRIYYVMTQHGPMPVDINQYPLDYEHYIDRQIKPVADSILNAFDESFDSLVSGSQLDLFDL